jgi:hypothetical protein
MGKTGLAVRIGGDVSRGSRSRGTAKGCRLRIQRIGNWLYKGDKRIPLCARSCSFSRVSATSRL